MYYMSYSDHFHAYVFFFFLNDTATTEIYTLSLHDALPISCRVDAAELAGRLEDPRQHLVEVDRSGKLTEDLAAAPLLLGALERNGELPPERVHARVEAGDHLGDPLLRGRIPPSPDDEQDQEEDDERPEPSRDPDQHVGCHVAAGGARRHPDSLWCRSPPLSTTCKSEKRRST